jgi:signal transduction histidine kinase
MATAASFVVMTLEHRALVERLETSLDELTASRARISAVAYDTRRHIERDLHDGAQQRLIALRLKLAMLGDRLAGVDAQSAHEARMLGDQAERAIDEIRDLARGIYPSILADRGLGDALASVAQAAPIPTTVHAPNIPRYPPEIESAVYFACVEAVQNAAKHAGDARHIAITLSVNGDLHFEVTDDGGGHVQAHNGAVTRLRDRIRAVGGDVAVAPTTAGGTRVAGRVPVS